MPASHPSVVTRLSRAVLAALALASFGSPFAMAGALPPANQHLDWYTGNVGACESAWALNAIQWRFSRREAEFWHSGLEILAFDRVGETRGLPHGSASVAQRNCTAIAIMNDHRDRRVNYTIIENGGLLGVTDGVEFCVSGLDLFARDCNLPRR